MAVTERDLGYAKIMRELIKLERTVVKVGIQSDAGSDDDGVQIVDKAFWNEFGTNNEDGTTRIPERSFVRASFDENRKDIDTTIDRLWNGVIEGKINASRAAAILGQRHEDQVKKYVRTGSFEANAASTIAAKGSSKPLINTGEMVNSIRYEVD